MLLPEIRLWSTAMYFLCHNTIIVFFLLHVGVQVDYNVVHLRTSLV
jgi:hypothetical protein